MAEQLLNGAQVGAALQQVGRERVPERVRADAHARAARGNVAPHQAVHASDRQSPAAVIHEQRFAFAGAARVSYGVSYVVSGFSRTVITVRLKADTTYAMF